MKHRVFVTDASYPNALAAVRSLGEAGFEVTAADKRSVGLAARLAFWSRYCRHRFTYPDPRQNPEGAADAISRYVRDNECAAAIPVGLDMTELFVLQRARIGVPAMLPSRESFAIASDKRLTFRHARDAGIPVPRTASVDEWSEFQPPFVLKHVRAGANILATPAEAVSRIRALNGCSDDHLIQEYVPGRNGYGYFGFFWQGKEVAYFMHERLVQFPKDGGPSVVARSIREERLRELGKRLLESLDWHGVAMVEFKRSVRDGEFYLIEINPKLWGSLDLAIAAGADFPAWIARAAIDGTLPESGGNYDVGVTYQWLIPHGVKSFVRYPEFRGAFLRNLASFGIRKDVRLTDPLPTAAGLFAMGMNAIR
jgi:predicted ATP-grasp superfamily ATP-dependent carboligase